jgi:CheY-like chemotaxis protein
VELKRQCGEIAPIVAKAVEMATPLIEQRSHKLSVHVPAQGLVVDVDPSRIAQALANLLTNAAKYTESGGTITVIAERERDEVVLRVRDSGIGISKEMLPKIFELFTQERGSEARSQGGLGIGLNVVRSLIELHSGAVSAHSDGLGKGSEFVVRLPALPLDHVEAAAPDAPPQPSQRAGEPRRRTERILIVDDNVDAAEVLAEALHSLGYATWVTHDAPEALRVLAEVDLTIAIVDIGLPAMDGYDLARHMRSQRPQLRLVAVTGYGQEDDRARAIEAGFDEHLVKPIDIERLGQALEHLAQCRIAGAR